MASYGGEDKKMTNEKVVLDIQDVKKEVKKKTILYPLSYQLRKGKILALCGGNGAGKSTLIRTIVGLIQPSEGKVTINGKEKSDKKNFAKQFGYMPDHFDFQRSITAKETIRFYARLKKVDKEQINEVLQKVGLKEAQQKKMGTFSKGMSQRMLLAQTLLAEPPLLILDEPTNGLDPYWIREFSKLMLKAKENGQTVVFSTHDLNVAEKIADEVIFLNEGRVISKGSIDNYNDIGLYETFQQLFFASLKNK